MWPAFTGLQICPNSLGLYPTTKTTAKTHLKPLKFFEKKPKQKMNALFFQRQHRFLLLNICHFQKLFFSDQSWLSKKRNPLIKWPPPSSSPCNQPHPIPNRTFSQSNFSIISNLLKNSTITSGSSLESALDQTEIDPDPGLLQAIFECFDSSPKLLHHLFLWAEKKPGFKSSATLFDSMVNVLGKARGFEDAWSLVLDRIGDGMEGSTLVSVNTFVILIRRYARAGNFLDILHKKLGTCLCLEV